MHRSLIYADDAKFYSQSDIVSVGWQDPYFSLAAYWAPTIYQYVKNDDTYGYSQDYITRFDYDGDWIGNNNWDNFPSYINNLYGYVYYAVIESETHYFIFYMFYHPRDWGKLFGLISDTHENDMEGIMVAITKDGTTYGSLLVMLTRAHMDFYQYSADPNVGDGADNVDGDIDLDGHRPIVYVEAQGHGVYGVPSKVDDYYSNDGYIIYRYNRNATQHPDYVSDKYNISYALIPIIQAFWPKALDPSYIGDGKMFDKTFTYSNSRYARSLTVPQSFDGDDGSTDAANPPWGMHDSDYDSAGLTLGDFFFDPANYTYTIFSIPYDFSLNYVYNPYLLEEGSPEFNYPDIQIFFPKADSFVNSTQVNISWSVSDESSLYKISVILDNDTILYEGTRKGANWVLANLSEGLHQINITAIDVWGNYRSVVRKFYVDVTPPSLSLISPQNNSEFNYTRNLKVSWDGSDSLSGIDHYEVRLDDGSWINVYLNESYEIANASLYNHTFYIKAIDKAGNMVMKRLVFSLRPVEVSVGMDNSSSLIAGQGNIKINLGDGDYDKVEAYLNNTEVPIYGDSIMISGFDDGHYILKIKVYYPSGDIDEHSWNITIDNTPPEITDINKHYSGNLLNITWGYKDLIGADHFEVFFDGSWHYLGNTTWYTINTSNLDEEYYIIIIRGYDLLGNYRNVVYIFNIDNTPPQVELFCTNNNSYWNKKSMNISIVAHDPSGIDKITVYLNNSLIGVYSNSATISIDFPEIGYYVLHVIVNDTRGNSYSLSYSVYVDWEKPDVSINEPSDLESVSGSFNISWSCSENAEYYIRIDNGEWIYLGSQNYYTVDSLTQGFHAIYVLAIDKAGNIGLSRITIMYEIQNKNRNIDSSITIQSTLEQTIQQRKIIELNTSSKNHKASKSNYTRKVKIVHANIIGTIISYSAPTTNIEISQQSDLECTQLQASPTPPYPIFGINFFCRSANSRRTSSSS